MPSESTELSGNMANSRARCEKRRGSWGEWLGRMSVTCTNPPGLDRRHLLYRADWGNGTETALRRWSPVSPCKSNHAPLAADTGSNKVEILHHCSITVSIYFLFYFYCPHLYTIIRTFYFLHWENVFVAFVFKIHTFCAKNSVVSLNIKIGKIGSCYFKCNIHEWLSL